MSGSVIILGAGLAGLSAAYHLKELGITCEVFEKESYVGGHCRTKQVDGFNFDDRARKIAFVLAVIGVSVIRIEQRHELIRAWLRLRKRLRKSFQIGIEINCAARRELFDFHRGNPHAAGNEASGQRVAWLRRIGHQHQQAA